MASQKPTRAKQFSHVQAAKGADKLINCHSHDDDASALMLMMMMMGLEWEAGSWGRVPRLRAGHI